MNCFIRKYIHTYTMPVPWPIIPAFRLTKKVVRLCDEFIYYLICACNYARKKTRNGLFYV